MMSLQQEYTNYVPSAVWPTSIYRINIVYNTMSRAVRDASDADKRLLFDTLLRIGDEFRGSAATLTNTQNAFDLWHRGNVWLLTGLSFGWTDGSRGRHSHLTLGLAQKYLNLLLKDWWGCGAYGTLDYSVLHAPFDNVVWKVLWELHPRFDCPSLKRGVSYKGISHWDSDEEYRSYQAHLLSPALNQAVMRQMQNRLRQVGLTQPPPTRIEMEQLVWSR